MVAFKELVDPETEKGKINREIIKIVDSEPGLPKVEIARRAGKITDKSPNTIQKTYINELEDFVFDREEAKGSHRLSISEEGYKLSRKAGLRLPRSFPRMLIEILENKLESETLAPEERRKLNEALTEDTKEALWKISKKHPLKETDRKKIRELIEDSVEEGHPNPIPILKAAWIFDAQKDKRLNPYLAKLLALLRTEGGGMIDALTIAERKGCGENLDKLSKILNGLANKSEDLWEIRETIQEAYRTTPEKAKPTSPQLPASPSKGEGERATEREADTAPNPKEKENTASWKEEKSMREMRPEEREEYMDYLGIPSEPAEDKQSDKRNTKNDIS